MGAHSEIIGNEVYVYMNGKLLYKRWLDTDQSILFDGASVYRGSDKTLSITDKNVVQYLLNKYCSKV